MGPVGDYNGDGKADIVCVGTDGFDRQDGSGILVSYSTGSGFTSYFNDACGANPTFMKMDRNGDGLDDLLCTSGDPQQAYVYGIYPDAGMLHMLTRTGAFCTTGSYWTGDALMQSWR